MSSPSPGWANMPIIICAPIAVCGGTRPDATVFKQLLAAHKLEIKRPHGWRQPCLVFRCIVVEHGLTAARQPRPKGVHDQRVQRDAFNFARDLPSLVIFSTMAGSK